MAMFSTLIKVLIQEILFQKAYRNSIYTIGYVQKYYHSILCQSRFFQITQANELESCLIFYLYLLIGFTMLR